MNGWMNIFDYCLLTLTGETALRCWNSQYHRAMSFIFLCSAGSVDLLLCTSYIFFYTFTRGLAMAVAVWVGLGRTQMIIGAVRVRYCPNLKSPFSDFV